MRKKRREVDGDGKKTRRVLIRRGDAVVEYFAQADKSYHVSVDGETFAHCGDDANGDWIYSTTRL